MKLMQHTEGFSWIPTDHVQGTTKEFAGVNLLGDYEFSMTINADQLPNYYEMANVAYGPEPLAAIAPGCDVKDDGNGAYLTDGIYRRAHQRNLA